MKDFKVHFVHVGNMNNKGTQALFKSDVDTIHEVMASKVHASVSTTDIEGVQKLNLNLDAILPSTVDIPYEKADQMAKNFGFGRSGIKYKAFAVWMLFYMIVQTFLSVFSVLAIKVGVKPLYRPQVFDKLKNSDLVISHSDESFKETASLLPINLYWILTWWSMLWTRTFEVLVALSFKRPVVLFPNSVGPFRTRVGEYLSKLALRNCRCLLIRDPVSYSIVGSMNINAPTILTYDTAILFKTEQKTILPDSRPLLGVSPGMYSHSLSGTGVEKYVNAHVKALDYAVSNYGFSIVFLPHYVSGFRFDDLETCRIIQEKMKNIDSTRIIEAKSVEEFKSLLNEMDIVISSKMHPAILAVSGFVPVLCVAYDHKQTAFFERLGMAKVIVDIGSIDSKDLIEKVDYVWLNRSELETVLKKQIPIWQDHVKKSIKETVALFHLS